MDLGSLGLGKGGLVGHFLIPPGVKLVHGACGLLACCDGRQRHLLAHGGQPGGHLQTWSKYLIALRVRETLGVMGEPRNGEYLHPNGWRLGQGHPTKLSPSQGS